MATIMNASTHNKVCCSALKCHEEATVPIRVIVDSLTRKEATTGTPIPVEVVLDYCERHVPEES